MPHCLPEVVSCINQKFENKMIPFSSTLLKETAPYIILIEDHSRSQLADPLYQYPVFLGKIEKMIFCCLNEKGEKEEVERPTELFVSKAMLYSPYHYLVTFL